MRKLNVACEFVKSAKQPEANSTYFEGYASTWTKDLGGDTIMPGAFANTIRQRLSKNLIKVRWMHYEPFGLCTEAHEDTKGLYVKGKASNTPTNMERFVMMQDGTVDRLSIGYDFPSEDSYTWIDDGTYWGARNIHEVDLYEWSPVDLAMNEDTDLTLAKSLMDMGIELPEKFLKALNSQKQNKGATTYSNLALGDRNRTWDGSASEKRVRSWAKAEDAPNAQYRKAFFWFDSDNEENFTAYKLGFADVIDGNLVAIPKGIFAAAAAIQGARGGVDIPESDISKVKAHIDKYYAKMADEFNDDTIVSPWNQDQNSTSEGKTYTINIWQDGKLLESKVVSNINNIMETKIGAELSKKNRTKLETARDTINEVLKDTDTSNSEDNSDNSDNSKILIMPKVDDWKSVDFTDIFADIRQTIQR